MSKKTKNPNLKTAANPNTTTKKTTAKQAQEKALAELRKLVMAELGL